MDSSDNNSYANLIPPSNLAMSTLTSTYEVVVSIIYKRTPDLKVDLDYLLKTHVPMVIKA